MKFRKIFIGLTLGMISSMVSCMCNFERLPHQRNLLGNEKSPYLQQHKNNPVWWQPWGEETLKIAKQQDKPIFLSIGYSTCHWCHVMEHESFEDKQVAKILNDSFVAIKVDREERPDIDALYMSFVQGTTGHGGWPMSVWMTPEGKPFFGGTYFPRPQFLEILGRIRDAWKNDRPRVGESAERLAQALREESKLGFASGTKLPIEELLDQFVDYHMENFDSVEGGFRDAPKFPQTMNLMALLRIARRVKSSSLKKKIHQMVRLTLDKMASGGMFDHLEGGFHRYSVDRYWLVPHFEKMLYDNALLSLTYTEAFQVFKEDEYANVVHETLGYILRQMTHPQGGFYAAEDADSLVVKTGHKEEGHYYVFSYAELTERLNPEELESVERIFGATRQGNFENKNILVLTAGHSRNDKEDLKPVIEKLLAHRQSKPRPLRDEKIIVSWNGLMIAAMAKAYQVLKKEDYLKAAQDAANYILKNLYKEQRLMRRSISGESRFSATADDYAHLIFGLLTLYESDFDAKWLDTAEKLQVHLDKLCWDFENGGYYKDDGTDATLIARTKDAYDGVKPTANSLSVLNLLKLGDFTYDKKYDERAEKILSIFEPRLKMAPQALPQMMIGLDYFYDRSKEVAVVGKESSEETQKILQLLRSGYFPNQVVAWGDGTENGVPLLRNKTTSHGKTTVYVCENKTCQMPTSDDSKVEALVKVFRELE